MPIAYMMGVEWEDCGKVAELLGIKTFINEFVAYERLGVLIGNRESGVGDIISVSDELNRNRVNTNGSPPNMAHWDISVQS